MGTQEEVLTQRWMTYIDLCHRARIIHLLDVMDRRTPIGLYDSLNNEARNTINRERRSIASAALNLNRIEEYPRGEPSLIFLDSDGYRHPAPEGLHAPSIPLFIFTGTHQFHRDVKRVVWDERDQAWVGLGEGDVKLPTPADLVCFEDPL